MRGQAAGRVVPHGLLDDSHARILFRIPFDFGHGRERDACVDDVVFEFLADGDRGVGRVFVVGEDCIFDRLPPASPAGGSILGGGITSRIVPSCLSSLVHIARDSLDAGLDLRGRHVEIFRCDVAKFGQALDQRAAFRQHLLFGVGQLLQITPGGSRE